MTQRTTTQAMIDEGIRSITNYGNFRFAVQLKDGRVGAGRNVAEALEAAKREDAENVLKVAA